MPVVRLSTKRIRALGWTNAMSTRRAMRTSLEAILEDVKFGQARMTARPSWANRPCSSTVTGSSTGP